MKAGIIKKVLTGALAFSLVMAPVMSVDAATEMGKEEKEFLEELLAEAGLLPSAEDDEDYSFSAPAEEATSSIVEVIPTTSEVSGVKTSTAGTYLATSVNGSAITTEAAAVSESYGLTGTEKPYSKFMNLDTKKSPLAKQTIDAAAQSQGAEVGPMLNIELGKLSDGKYSLLPSDGDAIRIALGVPRNFTDDSKTFAVVCVRAGGEVSILEDVDDNPNTVTFDTTGGAGAYAIIRY